MAKLTEEQERNILGYLIQGWTRGAIAEHYGVSASTVNKAIAKQKIEFNYVVTVYGSLQKGGREEQIGKYIMQAYDRKDLDKRAKARFKGVYNLRITGDYVGVSSNIPEGF